MTTRTTTTVAGLVACAALFAGCSTGTIPLELAQRAEAEDLEVGMSIAETRELLGDNFETRHEDYTRTWFYQTDSEDEWNDVFVVRFDTNWKVKDWMWAAE